jgi:hypothetical protein
MGYFNVCVCVSKGFGKFVGSTMVLSLFISKRNAQKGYVSIFDGSFIHRLKMDKNECFFNAQKLFYALVNLKIKVD